MPLEERPWGSTPWSLICLHTHTHTHTHTHWLCPTLEQHETKAYMRWGYIRTATVLQFSTKPELLGGGREERKKKRALHYSLERKTLKTNTPERVCLAACAGKSTCYVIREHMLLFSATSHWGRSATGGCENKASIITTRRHWHVGKLWLNLAACKGDICGREEMLTEIQASVFPLKKHSKNTSVVTSLTEY